VRRTRSRLRAKSYDSRTIGVGHVGTNLWAVFSPAFYILHRLRVIYVHIM
jgi:hypothetical protein